MGDVPDEVLLPLKERLADWEDVDVAGYFLGKSLGVISKETPWGGAKGLFSLANHLQRGHGAGVREDRGHDAFRSLR